MLILDQIANALEVTTCDLLDSELLKSRQIENKLQKPKCSVSEAHGNIYILIMMAVMALREHGLQDEVDELYEKVRVASMESNDFDALSKIVLEYIEPEDSILTAESQSKIQQM